MASFSLPLHSTPIPSRPTSSISPISKTHSQISFLRNPNPSFASKASSNNPQFARRDLLIGGLAIYGGSKMSEITGNSGESAAAETTPNRVVELSEFPITLDSVISVNVPRPKKSRTKAEKEEEEEVLAIQGIEFVAGDTVKFDVHVNDDEDALSRPDKAEFAGSFVYLPHKRKEVRTSLRLGITDLLEDLGADGDDSIKVTLVPKNIKRPVTVRQIKIEGLK
ncbi:polyphenol oxidase, chloroplastic [Pyrus x bretschneideri]|uniref:polyphenol oxidase, chloroplastic n=1 Tax=Pyrus x bretschneideri TaxID=225117 RepID=UPI0020302C9B|nr:polyphenol oxidase, chloroplastic [Pyrus x bretschneideri]